MLKNERQHKISELVKTKKSITVGKLASMLYVSEATVRRDLNELEKSGVLKRSHGGAFLPEGGAVESPGMIREMQSVHEKRLIAGLVRDFLRADTTVFMDSSSSAGAVIPYLGARSPVSVITNGIRNCLKLMEQGGARVYLCPGVVNGYSEAALGTDAVKYAAGFCADLCVISCGGISKMRGVTEASREQAQIKRQMLKNSAMRLLLCDSSKFGRDCMSILGGFDMFDYILTDTAPPPSLAEAIKSAGCEIITAQ